MSEDGKRISMSADGAWIEAPEATRERLKAAVQMLRKTRPVEHSWRCPQVVPNEDATLPLGRAFGSECRR